MATKPKTVTSTEATELAVTDEWVDRPLTADTWSADLNDLANLKAKADTTETSTEGITEAKWTRVRETTLAMAKVGRFIQDRIIGRLLASGVKASAINPNAVHTALKTEGSVVFVEDAKFRATLGSVDYFTKCLRIREVGTAANLTKFRGQDNRPNFKHFDTWCRYIGTEVGQWEDGKVAKELADVVTDKRGRITSAKVTGEKFTTRVSTKAPKTAEAKTAEAVTKATDTLRSELAEVRGKLAAAKGSGLPIVAEVMAMSRDELAALVADGAGTLAKIPEARRAEVGRLILAEMALAIPEAETTEADDFDLTEV